MTGIDVQHRALRPLGRRPPLSLRGAQALGDSIRGEILWATGGLPPFGQTASVMPNEDLEPFRCPWWTHDARQEPATTIARSTVRGMWLGLKHPSAIWSQHRARPTVTTYTRCWSHRPN